MSRIFTATVVRNVELAPNYFLISLHPKNRIPRPHAGNFFMLQVGTGLDPLLKRPFSLHRVSGGEIQFLYRSVGKGTALLGRRKPGDAIQVMGPLGNKFPLRKKSSSIILVAGGIGIAPLFALAESAADRHPYLFYGARTKREVLLLDDLKRLGLETVISTDDGSMGKKGNIIKVMKRYLSSRPSLRKNSIVYACGPQPMLRALTHFVNAVNIPAFAALEETMACGIGTCLGCVVRTIDGYQRVCREGPVFPLREIIW